MPSLATIAALCVAPQAQTITFVHEPAPVGRVVAQLAAQTGTKLRADAGLTEVVFVHATDVSLDDLKARIAQTARCRWRPGADGGEVLAADDVRRRNEANQAEAKHRASIAETLARWAGADPDRDESRGIFEMMGSMFGPMSDKLAKACAIAVGTSGLASVGEGGRLVWATDPTPSQLALSVPNLDALVAQAVKEHNASVVASEQALPDGVPPEQAEMMREMTAMMRAFGLGKKVEGKPAKVCFVVTRSDVWYRQGLTLEVRVYDEAGKQMITSSTSIAGDMEGMAVPKEEVEGGEAEAEAPPVGASWELSKEAAQLHEAMNGSIRSGDTTELAAVARKAIAEADKKDLLAYGVGEVLGNYAKAVGEDIVAWVPDSVFHSLGTLTGQAAVEAAFQEGADLQKATAGGWTTIAPSNPVRARREAFHREDLAALASASLPQGRPGLDALATYALRNPDPRGTGLAGMAMLILGAGREGFGMSEDNWLVLRLYGSLSSGQRQSTALSFTLANGIWSQLQRRTVSQWVFGPDPQLSQVANPDLISELGRELPFGVGGSKDLALEPTVAAPGGLAGLGAIQFERSEESCFRPVSGVQGGFPDSVGVEEMALLHYILSQEDVRKSIEAEQPLPTSFLVGRRQVVTVRIPVGPAAFVVGRLTEDAYDGAAEAVGLGDLPPADLARMKSLATELGKGPFGVFFKMIGGMRNIMQPETPPPGS